MSTKLFGPELYQRLDDEFESKTNSARNSVRIIRDALVAIADGSVRTQAIAHDYGWMALHLANFVHTDGTVHGVVLHGWCLRPKSRITDIHMHSFDMKSRVILKAVNNQPVDVQLLAPDSASPHNEGVFRVFDAISDPGGRDSLVDTGRLAAARINEEERQTVEEGRQYRMKIRDWHRSEIDPPDSTQIRETDFPVSLMISSHRPDMNNFVLDNRPIYPISPDDAPLPTMEIQRGLYAPEETRLIAQHYAGALGLDGFN